MISHQSKLAATDPQAALRMFMRKLLPDRLPHALSLLTEAFIILLMPLPASFAHARPANVVVIVADDLGYADVGFNGGTQIKTPNIDGLARQGTVFTNGYATAAVCSPSRAGIMTGRYQQRFGHENNQPAGFTGGLPLSQVTMADVMQRAGYTTGMIGKWHLGNEPALYPNQRGFVYSYGFYQSTSNYLGTIKLRLNGKIVYETKRYLTTAFGDEAAAFIHRNKDHPFFLYLPFNAPHVPLQATETDLAQYANIADPTRRTYAAMVSALDDAVGVVANALETDGLSNDTFLVFLSDNGGSLAHGAKNTPLRQGKPTAFEGGIRVPFFVRWPAGLAGGRTYSLPVSTLDILPTIASATGAQLPTVPLDGVDLLPYLRGTVTIAPHYALFWRMDSRTAAAHSAVRLGPNKLVDYELGTRVFNLANDLGEMKNVQTPALLNQLQEAYAQCERQMIPPLWNSN